VDECVVEWVSVRRAAELLGCAPQTVHRMIADGELSASRMTTEAGHQRTLVGLASVEARRVARASSAA
jgi:excisionase family DNA binding protein